MVNKVDNADWRSVMLAQYSIFGTIAGLEIAALALFVTLSKSPIPLLSKLIFTTTFFALSIEVPILLWLINEERKTAFNVNNMNWFIEHETVFRNLLNMSMCIGWLSIIVLLGTSIWCG